MIGAIVKLSNDFIQANQNTETEDHVNEFKNSTGVIIECLGDSIYDVRWNEGFRYAYHITNLDLQK